MQGRIFLTRNYSVRQDGAAYTGDSDVSPIDRTFSGVRAARTVVVQGIVQGVGFRPFVHGLAARLGLCGSVRNRHGDVLIEVEGARSELDQFMTELLRNP